MSISIDRRRLTESEIRELVHDIRLYPNLMYVSPSRFRNLKNPYCISKNNHFAGVCGIYSFGTWIKLGPLALLRRYHGLGIGKKLLDTIISDHANTSVYIASSNPVVQHVVTSRGFKQIPNYVQLPYEVKRFLIKQLVEHLNINFLKESVRKKFFLHRDKIKFYVLKHLCNH